MQNSIPKHFPAWTDWPDWGGCSLTCATGTQSRTRTCHDPGIPGTAADATCSADPSTENQDCNTQTCPGTCAIGP